MEASLGRLHQVAQRAEDLDRAVDFYREVLALRFIARFQDATGMRINLRELTYQTLGQLAAAHGEAIAVPLPDKGRGLVARLRRKLQRAISAETGD